MWVLLCCCSHLLEKFPNKQHISQNVVCLSECGFTDMDVVFGLPLSPLVTEGAFRSMINLVRTSVQNSYLDNGQTRIGLFLFDTEVKQSFVVNLMDFDEHTSFVSALDSLPYIPSFHSPSLEVALLQFETMFSSPGRGNRLEAPDIGYLVMDSTFDLRGSVDNAEHLRNLNVRVDIAAVEYKDTATPGLFAYSEDHVYLVENYDALGSLMSDLFREEQCSKLCHC